MLIHRLQSKPNPGVGVDRQHPLASGLICAIPFNEGCGTNLVDATGYPIAHTLSGTDLTWSPTLSGPGVKFPAGGATTQGVAVSNDAAFAGLTALSMLCVFYHNGGGGGTKGRIIERRIGGTQDLIFYYDVGVAAWVYAIGTGANNAPAAPSTVGGYHTVVGVWQASTKAGVWIDGVWYPLTFAAPDAGPTSSSAGTTYIGNRTTGDRAFDGTFALFLAWNRALSDAEAVQINANPWQVFRSPSSYPWRAASASTLSRRSLYFRAGSRGVA